MVRTFAVLHDDVEHSLVIDEGVFVAHNIDVLQIS